MDELVEKLSRGDHRVELVLRPKRTPTALKECVERGFVHIRFTETRGGTELGVQVDPALSDFASLEVAAETGQLRVVGTLSLNYVPVRCIADIDLPSYEGRGRLEVVASPPAA